MTTTDVRQQGQQGQAGRALCQEVTLTLDDGRKLRFSGPAQVGMDEVTNGGLRVVDIAFSQPIPLPPGATWGKVGADGVPPDHGLDSDA